MAANMENLPDHLLLDIFSLVPASDLICHCRLVCSQWRDLVDLPVLWKRKYERKEHDSSPKPLDFYIFSRLKKNLIKNPCGQDGLDSWEIQTPSEGLWETEDVSVEEFARFQGKMCPYVIYWSNRKQMDKDAPVQVKKCFASHDGPCSKSQLITLKDEGYWDKLMDKAGPTIVVQDLYSGNPGSRYKLTVKLLSADSEVLRQHQQAVPTFSATWFPALHIFEKCPPGVRHILFQHEVCKDDARPSFHDLLVQQPSPSEDGQPSWGGMRLTHSTILLLSTFRDEKDECDCDCDYSNSDDDFDFVDRLREEGL